MLDHPISFEEAANAYDLEMVMDNDWATSRRRVLIIMQSVDSTDLNTGRLCSTPTIKNAITHSKKLAHRYAQDLGHFAFAVTNFNARRHLNLRGQAFAEAEAEFKARQLKLIQKLKPTHILFSGDLNLLYPVKHAAMKNGWVHDIDGRKVVSTVDYGRIMEKQGTYANLLGFFCRHLANLLLGHMPHSLAHVKAKPVLVDTLEKFDKVMALWDRAKLCGVDTETKNLSVTSNAIYTIQFAFDQKPTHGYVLPIDHPHADNPFSKDDRKYIKRELQKRFGAETGPELVTFNGMFDLRIIRVALKLPIIYLNVWEITAGEHNLDENISSLASIGIKAGGLAAVYCSYGNDFYFSDDTSFSKSERSTVGSISPYDEGFLMYGSTDVVSILHIREQQIARADKVDINGKPWRDMFIRHTLYQMGDTAHQLSHLKQEGSLIDKRYLRNLMKPDSVLAKAISELQEEFKTFPEVIEANRQLLSESGFKAGSLFGNKGSQWVFSFTKSLHKAKLFLEVCGLKAISKTASGADAIDKPFIEHYKDRNYLVAKFGEFQASAKLLSTYVKGWYRQLTKEIDGVTDDHLRADYKFFDVDTGRLASGNPNLQNVPSRGKLSKIIKEMFITMDGYLLVRFDYSAHEVRGWSIAAGDTVLAAAFKAGQKLRQQYIKTPPIKQADLALKARLEEWFTYDKDTGKFFWKKVSSRRVHIGDEAGNKRKDGWYLQLEGALIPAHRAAFLVTYSYLPDEVDHKDNDCHNNRISNLRPASRQENSRNRRMDSTKSSSGYKGVYPGPNGRWVAQIKPSAEEKSKHLGVFDTPEEAHTAYVRAAKKYHGDFANDGESSMSKDVGDYRHPSLRIKQELRTKGDIHIQNCFRFFGRWVEKTDPLRDAIKAVVFGVLYGKSASTLGNDTKRTDLDAVKAKINAAYKANDKKALATHVAEFERILEEDRSENAQEIIDKMFNEFKRGDQWVKRMQRMATEHFYVFSPIGRIRHLYAAMTGVKSIISRQVRRGMNAPIQGFASEIAVKASRRVMVSYYKDRAKIDKLLGRQKSKDIKFNRIVHDALYFTVPYNMVIPFMHILQYEATYGVAQAYEREFGLKFTVEPEIEMEFGTKDTNSTKWDWSLPELRKILETTVDDGIKAGLLTESKEAIMQQIWEPWRDRKTLAYLDKTYPLLGVSLQKEISDAIR